MKRFLIAAAAFVALTIAANADNEEDHYDWIKAQMPSSAINDQWCEQPPSKFKSDWDVRGYVLKPVCGQGLKIERDSFTWWGQQRGTCKVVGVDRLRWKEQLYGKEDDDPTKARMYRVNCVGTGEFRFMEVPQSKYLEHNIVVYFPPYPAMATPERKK